MAVVIVTGSAGLIGSEAVRHFTKRGMHAVGIDNDMRSYFFGKEASTAWMSRELSGHIADYEHCAIDIRNMDAISRLFQRYGRAISLVIHTAAQPSHDWAAREPLTDFSINATGTLNMLEATRLHAPDAAFIFTSTNKVYGDAPNRLPLRELDTRWEIEAGHAFGEGINESMIIDQSMHSVFGASKVAADVMVQEYGRYFGMKTTCFRGGCLTGPNHSPSQLHGFLAYLMKCCMTGAPYKVFGYKGKQVRDNIHSADLIAAFEEVSIAPRSGEVYNIGGSRYSSCSMLEAIIICEEITGRELVRTYEDSNRAGDHVWWISDVRRFQRHYPNWRLRYNVRSILKEIYDGAKERWQSAAERASA